MARGSAGESVLQKHLRVLGAFDSLRPFLTLSQIAESAGLPASSAHRLVGELEREGLLERLPDRSYRLGVRLWEIACNTPGALGLREIAQPWLSALHARIRQHVQLGVLSGHDVLFIERMSARGAVINATLIGGRIPLSASSSGLVLLAHAPSDLVDEIVAAGLRVYTDRTIRTEKDLRDRLRRVRADGYAVTDGFIHLESRGIAVPVFGPGGIVYAAISVVVANDELSPQGHIELLTVAATGVTRALEDAYLPVVAAEGVGGRGIRLVAGASQRSLEYFASVGNGVPSPVRGGLK